MKKIIGVLLSLVLLISVVGCSGEPDNGADTNGSQEEAGSITKLGLGTVVSIANSEEAEEGKEAKSQADVTIAAVGFDDDGKIQSVTVDVAQTQVEFDSDLKVVSDLDKEYKTKHELKEDYGMKDVSEKIGIGKEWYEQMNAFQEWMVGKTVDEITSLEVKEVDEDHQSVPDVEELTSSVTIDVGDYIKAVEEAWENTKDLDGAEEVGLGVKTTINNSKGMKDDQNAYAQIDTAMASTAFDSEGNVVKTIMDVVQAKVEYDEEGKLITDLDKEIKTKHELKEEYGMKDVSEKIGIGKEWYEQMNAFEEWMEGKSVDEITSLEVKEVDEDHQSVPDVEELTSSVTIDVGDHLEVIKKASENAK